MEIRVCECGGVPEVVKMFPKNRQDCLIRCPSCGRETKCYTSRQNAVKAWNDMRFSVIETEKMVELLRKRAMEGRMEVRDKSLMMEAADRLESQSDSLEVWSGAYELMKKRESYQRYVTYWREKNGEDELCYPDAGAVYEDFFALLDKMGGGE